MAGMESKNILLTSLLYYSFFGTFNFTTFKKIIYSTGTVTYYFTDYLCYPKHVINLIVAAKMVELYIK